MKNTVMYPAILILSLLLAGCGHTPVQVDDSEFLEPIQGFVESGDLEGTKTYVSPTADFSEYSTIYIEPVKIFPALNNEDLSEGQRQLKKQISDYLTSRYREVFANTTSYTVVDSKDMPNTLILESSISAVTVEFDELGGMSYMPMMFVGTMVARATFQDGNIRLLGESRLRDSQSGDVLIQMMRLQKGKASNSNAEELVFADIKPTLDEWLEASKRNLIKIRAGIVAGKQ